MKQRHQNNGLRKLCGFPQRQLVGQVETRLDAHRRKGLPKGHYATLGGETPLVGGPFSSQCRFGRDRRHPVASSGLRTANDCPMTTTARPQQRYDHRLRELVHRTRDVTVATDLGVPYGATNRPWAANWSAVGAIPT